MQRRRVMRDVAVFVAVATGGALLFLRSTSQDYSFEDPGSDRVIAAPDPYLPGQVLVGFTATAGRAPVRELLGVQSFRKLPIAGIELWSLPEDVTVQAAIQRLRDLPEVRFAEPNMMFSAAALPSDPRFPSQWGLHNTGRTVDGKVGDRDADVDAPEAWAETNTRGSGSLVAVIDSGTAYNHQDLAPNMWTNAKEDGARGSNGVDDDGNGYVDDARGWDWVDGDPDPSDPYGHGTHVAGTIAARTGDRAGIAGIAPESKLVGLRVLDAVGLGASDAIASAIVYASRAGANVVNLSIVGPRSETVLAALAAVPDAVFVAAAGNDGVDLSASPTFPCAYELDNLVCVGASDSTDALAAFSNRGGPVDIAAPGDRIISTSPSFVKPLVADFETDNGWSLGPGWSRPSDARGYFLSAGSPPAGSGATTNDVVDLSGAVGCTLSFVAKAGLGTGTRAVIEAELEGGWEEIAFLDEADNGQWGRHSFSAAPLDRTRSRLRYTLVGEGSIAVDDLTVKCVSGSARAYKFGSGTSMAAPFVAGVAALTRALAPDASPSEIISALTAGGDKVTSLSGSVACGCRLNANGAAKAVTR